MAPDERIDPKQDAAEPEPEAHRQGGRRRGARTWKGFAQRTAISVVILLLSSLLGIAGGQAGWDMLHGQFEATETFPSGRLPALIGCWLLAAPMLYAVYAIWRGEVDVE